MLIFTTVANSTPESFNRIPVGAIWHVIVKTFYYNNQTKLDSMNPHSLYSGTMRLWDLKVVIVGQVVIAPETGNNCCPSDNCICTSLNRISASSRLHAWATINAHRYTDTPMLGYWFSTLWSNQSSPPLSLPLNSTRQQYCHFVFKFWVMRFAYMYFKSVGQRGRDWSVRGNLWVNVCFEVAQMGF